MAVLLLHLLLAAALLHFTVLQRAPQQEQMVSVRLLQVQQPEQPPFLPPALPAVQRVSSPQLPWIPAPEVPTAEPPSAATITVQVQTAAPAASPAPVVEAPVAALAAPAPVAPPAAPREIPPGAIAYRVAPPVAVPLASRRLRESGVVWLRVHVDRQGLPQRVSLHKSSGHARLDEQALAAMQQARFVPQTENGQPIEWVVIAPIAYEVD